MKVQNYVFVHMKQNKGKFSLCLQAHRVLKAQYM